MKETMAWLLDFGHGRVAAVGERELLHLLPQPRLLEVPLAPAQCARVLHWQDQLLPVWDVLAWLGERPHAAEDRLVAIVGYQRRPRETPLFGVLALAEPPVRVRVSDSQACELPEREPWQAIAASCFLREERPVPILDLRKMFSGPV